MFYASKLLHIIETFHEKSFIYRDLKPKNVMVCADEYLKLIDLQETERKREEFLRDDRDTEMHGS